MCLIIDTCAIHSVFDKKSESHKDFRPILDWLTLKNGKLIVGGTKYNNEFHRSTKKYLNILAELKRNNKIIKLPTSEVDREQARVQELEPAQEFDDPHLIAIVRVSKCKLLCTHEERGMKYLTRADLYRPAATRPKIYKRREHERLLRDSRLIATICKLKDKPKD